METTFALLTAASATILAATVMVYERMLTDARRENEVLLDVLDDHVDQMRQEAKDRHPSQQYGGANLRIVR